MRSDDELSSDAASPSPPPDVADLDSSRMDVDEVGSDAFDLPDDLSEADFDLELSFPRPGAVLTEPGAPCSSVLGRDRLTVATRSDVTLWLAGAVQERWVTGMELYSPPRVLPQVRRLQRLTERCGSFSFDVQQGWNFDLESLRALSLEMIATGQVRFLHLSTMFSELTRLWQARGRICIRGTDEGRNSLHGAQYGGRSTPM